MPARALRTLKFKDSHGQWLHGKCRYPSKLTAMLKDNCTSRLLVSVLFLR